MTRSNRSAVPTRLTVTGTETLTARLRRVWFRSDDLSAFAASAHTDRYVKLVFPKPGVDYPEPLDMRVLRQTLPPEDMPVVRTYTALFPDVDAGTLAIDFVVHGDEGVAGPWARRAAPGDVLLANGPGGAYRPDPDADWHLLVGDESAVPAITAALAVLPEDAVVAGGRAGRLARRRARPAGARQGGAGVRPPERGRRRRPAGGGRAGPGLAVGSRGRVRPRRGAGDHAPRAAVPVRRARTGP